MFGLFKKLFSKPDSPPPTAAPITDKPAHAAAPAPRPAPTQTGDVISLPLNEILARLPGDLAAQVLSRPGVMFPLSASFALAQLRTGAVRIPFGQLRQGSPPGTFVDNAAHDNSLIDLPLPLILAAIGPAGLARRPDQKQASVPDEVTGIFGTEHGRLTHAAKEAPAPAAPKPITPVVPKPAVPTVPPPAAHKPAFSFPSVPAAPKAPAPAPIPFAAPKPASSPPHATARPTPPPPAAAHVPTGETVGITLAAVSAAWPAPVRQEIEMFNLGNSTISIPVGRLEAGMKSGRIAFTWAELCGWLSLPMPPPANGECQVELPLQVIVPLFLAKHRAATPRKVVSIDANLPDLFAGLGRPVAPASASATAPATATAPVVAPPQPAPAVAANALGQILGQPEKRDWTPQEIAQQILSLPGIAGVLLASNDGLLVAGQMPAPLKAETLAAFLPRIFTHAGLCTGEVQLGTLRALRLSAGPASCVVCKAGTLYLAALGQPGQALPEAALERIAAELAQQNH
jgi:predicted regulator of Ras-like GTPase activity (Roadblock/LC7/MglB family)